MRPIYLLATDSDGNVQGTWRLLPTTGPYILRDVFAELMDDQQLPDHPQIWETSRFAVEPGPDGCDRRVSVNALTGELFAGLVEWSLTFGIREIVTVYDVRVGRLLNRIGVSPLWVSQRRRIGNTLTVAGRFEISDSVLASIKAACGVEESVLVNHDAIKAPAVAECSMPHDRSNMLQFALYRGRRVESDRQPQPEPELQSSREEEIRAIVSCLEYLYGETIKLDRRMAAHLIGAAAQALRHEQSEGACTG